jgi:hypothetical protein
LESLKKNVATEARAMQRKQAEEAEEASKQQARNKPEQRGVEPHAANLDQVAVKGRAEVTVPVNSCFFLPAGTAHSGPK